MIATRSARSRSSKPADAHGLPQPLASDNSKVAQIRRQMPALSVRYQPYVARPEASLPIFPPGSYLALVSPMGAAVKRIEQGWFNGGQVARPAS